MISDNIEFIARHLVVPEKINKQESICAICGRVTNNYFSKKECLSGTFTDFDKFRYDSDSICSYCNSCLAGNAFDGKAIRNFCIIVTENYIEKVDRKKMVDFFKKISLGDAGSNVVIYSYNRKKHAFFFAEVNEIKQRDIVVATDKGRLFFNVDEFLRYYNIAKALYDGGFSKQEIKRGKSTKYKVILNFGGTVVFQNKINQLSTCAGNNYFDLLIDLLYKDERNDKN